MKLLKSVAATVLVLSFTACGQGSTSQTAGDETPAAPAAQAPAAQAPGAQTSAPVPTAAASQWTEVAPDFRLYLAVALDPRTVSAHKFVRADGAVQQELWVAPKCQFVIGPLGKTLWAKGGFLPKAVGSLEPNPILAGSQYYTLTGLEPDALDCNK